MSAAMLAAGVGWATLEPPNEATIVDPDRTDDPETEPEQQTGGCHPDPQRR